jgi:PKD repeat protein
LRGLDLDSSQIKADFDSYNTHIKVGGGVQFNNKSLGDINEYKWEFKGGDPEFSESAIPPMIYYHKIGEYDVKLSVKSVKDKDSLIIKNYVRVLPNIYPNPSKYGKFNIVFGQAVPDDLEVNVYNASGQMIHFTIKQTGENLITIDLSAHPQGIYLIKIFSNGYVQTLKVGNKILTDSN